MFVSSWTHPAHIFECVIKAEFPNRSREHNYMLSFILMELWLYFLKRFCFYKILGSLVYVMLLVF